MSNAAHYNEIPLKLPQSDSDAGAPAAVAPSLIDTTIDAWFVEHFHGSIVSRDTEVYNHVHRAVADLKRRLSTGA